MNERQVRNKHRRDVFVRLFVCVVSIAFADYVAGSTTLTQPPLAISAYVQAANDTISACMDRQKKRECREDEARVASLYDEARAKLRYQRGNKVYLARHYDQWNAVIRLLAPGEGQGGKRLAPELERLHRLEAELY